MTLAVAPPAARLSPGTSPWLARVTAVGCLFGAEAIHSAVIGEHMAEWLFFGIFFLVLSVVEGLLAITLVMSRSRWATRLAIGVSLATVVLWLATRTIGLPIGPMAGEVEPIGRADTVATVLELITAVVLLSTSTATTLTRRSTRDYLFAALIISGVVALTAFGTAQAP